ncbi:hypothetical protein Drorol1_Dr00002729 [Drosera rotundifolia]
MDEYQERERFGMENDYEGGQWIGGEFYYRKRKDKARQTKEDVLYGVFASASSESDDDGSSSKKRRKGVIKKADFTKPVNFVSTGTVMPNEEIDRNAKEEMNYKEEDDEDDGYKPGLGLGAGSAGSGMGFISSLSVKSGDRMEKKGGGAEEDEEDDQESFLPTAFGRKIKEGAEQRREKSKLVSNGKSGSDGSKRRSEAFAGNNGVGTFEKYTKGIGMKLLEKMGYKGGGLGKKEQGIVAPIEAKLRPKNMGMGFNDYQEAKNVPSLETLRRESEENVQEPSKKKEMLWKKHAQSRASRKREEYITAQELLAKKQDQGAETILQKVVDMRGPQVRVLTNLENINAEETARESDVPMPELQHNIRLILDMTEVDIQDIDRKLRNETETVLALKEEKEKLQSELNRQKKQLNSMEEILRVLGLVEEQKKSGILTLESLEDYFRRLKTGFPTDYKLCNLSCIACSYALPLLIWKFQGWDPLLNPSHEVQLISSWKLLLQGEECLDFSDSTSPYAQLVMEVVFPAIRIAGSITWQPRDPEPMLAILESWESLLPPSVHQTILDMIVMKKLEDAVASWDPCRETISIHVWVHPWLPWLGQRLESLYQPIRSKMELALRAWIPSDGSAHTILSPWKTVFDQASWELLIARSIVPKLRTALQEFQVNPANQDLTIFGWVMAWASDIPIHHMVTLLEVDFFPKWEHVLYQWLSSSPDFEEVRLWYVGWTNLFPEELKANEGIRYHFQLALEMMNQAVRGAPLVQPGVEENISYMRAREQRQFEAQQKASTAYVQQQTSMGMGGTTQMDDTPEMSLKEVVEAYAQHNGLLFKPKPGRSYKGHQLYGFGSISIIIDTLNQKVFALSGEEWSLVSLEQLLQMQHLYASKRR